MVTGGFAAAEFDTGFDIGAGGSAGGGWRVEIGFSWGPNPLTWVLDSSPFPVTLGATEFSAVWSDVTEDVKRVSIHRGKNRDLDAFQAGRCSLDLENLHRKYDPLNLSGPYTFGDATLVKPGRPVRVYCTDPGTGIEYQLFRGFVREWSLDYPEPFRAIVTASCTDAMTELANSHVSLTTTAGTTGSAIGEVLTAAEVYDTVLDTGTPVQTMTFAGSAQQAIRVFEQTEQGNFFIEYDGYATFLDRDALITDARHTTSQASFGSSGIPLDKVDLAYESDVIKNHAVVTRQGGVTQEAEDASSIGEYGERALTLTGLAMVDDTTAQGLAEYIVAYRAEPSVRIKTMRLAPETDDDAFTQALSRRLMDRVTVNHVPRGGTDVVTQELFIIGIQHEVVRSPVPQPMFTTFTFGPTTGATPGWVLGVTAFPTTVGF